MTPLTCLAQAHLVNPKTGKLGSGDEWMRGVLRVYTMRAEVMRSPWPLSAFFEVRGRGRKSQVSPGRRPIQFDARRTGARSLRLPQRIITSFVQAQDFAAVEALIPDLKRCAEGFERPQVSTTDGLGRCRKPPIVRRGCLVRFARNSSAGAL